MLNGGIVAPVFAQDIQLDAGFDPNRILEDNDIFDLSAMNYERLVAFLKSRGTLADYRTPDIDGIPKTAPEIIWRVATSYKINPKYLLALIQKEQSLVEDPHPTQKQYDWAAGYGICDSCKMDDPSLQDFKGFASQMEWAAKQHREKYLLQLLGNGKTRSGNAPGKTIVIDGMKVTPVNNATAMLYSYTPHLHGNLNLWNIWKRWFSLIYPDGTVVRASGSKKTFLISLGQKRPFASRSVQESMVDANKVITVTDTELSSYPDGAPIQFSKYSLLRDEKKSIWLLTGETKRRIADMKTFWKFGFNEDEIIDVTSDDLAEYDDGAPITLKTHFPQGVVLQDQTSKEYWYIEDGIKHLIPAKVFLTLYFRGRAIKLSTSKKLAAYETGDVYRLHDAELIKGSGESSVYVMENGVLRPIPSADVFERIGWKWTNVVTVPKSTLTAYAIGEPVQTQLQVTADRVTTSTLSSL